MKGSILFLSLLFSAQFIFAQNWCNVPDQSFCPGNYFQNGDFEQITGDPNTVTPQDIDLAVGWSPLWQSNSLADLHCNGNGTGTAPTPNTNVYAGIWIENRSTLNTTNATYREGMYNELSIPIAQSSGSYAFNFKIANAQITTSAPVAIGIYGVYNPGNIVANNPTGLHAPSNVNLWQSVDPTVEVVLLGIVTTPASFTNAWINQSVSFNSAILPTNGISHIMVTSYDALSTGYAKLYVNFDEFCLQQSEPDFLSIYCCRDSVNLLVNGNFEFGDTGFSSQYTSTGSVLPGQYTVAPASIGSTISSAWLVDDHSNCAGGLGNNVLFVNGKTTQPAATTAVIWEQTLTGLDEEGTYKFCANFKNFPQCNFDVLPEIEVEILGASYSTIGGTINTNPTDICDWQLLSGKFFPFSSSVTIRIHLKEDGLGDGNDLAIDDISVQELEEAPVQITVRNRSIDQNTTQITASINNLTTTDDLLPSSECKYAWIVSEVTNISPLMLDWSTFMWGGTYGGSSWGLTTTFPGYNAGSPDGIFNTNTMYYVSLWVTECECYADNYTYQFTFDASKMSIEDLDLSRELELPQEAQNRIKEILKNKTIQTPTVNKPSFSQERLSANTLTVYPNPVSSKSNVDYQLSTEFEYAQLSLYDVHGRKIDEQQLTNATGNHQFDLTNLPSGQYLINLNADGQTVVTKRVLKH